MFAGRVGLFAIDPEERADNRPGFGGYPEIVNSDTVYVRMRTIPTRFDDRYFLRIS